LHLSLREDGRYRVFIGEAEYRHWRILGAIAICENGVKSDFDIAVTFAQ